MSKKITFFKVNSVQFVQTIIARLLVNELHNYYI